MSLETFDDCRVAAVFELDDYVVALVCSEEALRLGQRHVNAVV